MILKAIRYLVVNPSYFKINIAIFISSSKKNRGFSKIERKNIKYVRKMSNFVRIYTINNIY